MNVASQVVLVGGTIFSMMMQFFGTSMPVQPEVIDNPFKIIQMYTENHDDPFQCSGVVQDETDEQFSAPYTEVEGRLLESISEISIQRAHAEIGTQIMLAEVRKSKPKTGYAQKSSVEVYKEQSKKSRVIYQLDLNEKVEYTDLYNGWYELRGLNSGYVRAGTISEEIFIPYKTIKAPSSNGCKSMESYRVFRMTGSNLTNQGKLQNLAETDELGFRKVNGRYCIAVGSAVCDEIGTRIDLVLENDVVIPCVMGDQKADCHTDRSNFKSANGCISEFIVDLRKIDTTHGDVSYVQTEEDWMSPVVEFRVYDYNELDN